MKVGTLVGVADTLHGPVVEEDILVVGVDALVGIHTLVEAGIQGRGHYTH